MFCTNSTALVLRRRGHCVVAVHYYTPKTQRDWRTQCGVGLDADAIASLHASTTDSRSGAGSTHGSGS